MGAGTLAAGAQAPDPLDAAACAEPVFHDTFPYATTKQLVPMNLSGVTPGTEYLLKVNGKEVKQGIADTDTVSRKFRMPNLGDKRRDARLVVVLANDACANSPWKLKQKMRYRPLEPPPATEPTPPVSQPETTPTPTPTPQATPTPTPTPAPKLTTPKPVKPKVQTPAKPSLPTPPTAITPVTPLTPAPDARAWTTPIDPYAKGSEAAPQPPVSTNPADRATEDANSTAALIGLLGIFVVLGGLGAVAWTRFRRYDDEQLATLLNPDGKLPAMLDGQAVDLGADGMSAAQAESQVMAGGLGVGGSRMAMPAAAAAAAAAAAKPGTDQEVPAPAVSAPEPAEIKAPLIPPATIKAPIVPVAQSAPPVDAPKAPVVPPATIKAPIVPPAVEETAAVNGAHVSNGAHVPAPAEPPVADQPPVPDEPPARAPAPSPVPAPNGRRNRRPRIARRSRRSCSASCVRRASMPSSRASSPTLARRPSARAWRWTPTSCCARSTTRRRAPRSSRTGQGRARGTVSSASPRKSAVRPLPPATAEPALGLPVRGAVAA